MRPSSVQVAAIGVGVAAAAARLPRALGSPLWQDEVASARILQEPTLGGVLHHVVRTESTPPLWYVLGWLIHRTGVSIHDIRLLSVASGGMLAALVVVFAHRLVGLAGATAAGLLVAFGGEFAFQGHDLRAYELFALLTLVFALLLDAEATAPTGLTTSALAVATAAGTLTHYFFVFTVAAGLGWLWLEPTAAGRRRRAALAIAAGLAATTPWVPFALRQYRHDRFSWIGPFRLEGVLATPLRLFTPLAGAGAPGLVARLLCLGAVGAGSALLLRSGPRARLTAVLGLGPLAIAAALWLAGIRIYANRNLIGVGAFVAIAAVAAAARLPRRLGTVAPLVAAAALVVGFAWDQGHIHTVEYQRMARALLAEGWHPRDPVVVFGSWASFRSPLQWYLPHQPALQVVAAPRSTCPTMFVIRGRLLRRTGETHVVAERRIGSLLVLRLHAAPPALVPWLRDGYVLAAPSARLGCG